MMLTKLTSIKVLENRQRRQFDPKRLDELAQSIASKGLMHPIVVRNDGVTLVAGERRLRAMTALHQSGTPFMCHGQPVEPGHVPVTMLDELTPHELEEAELEENTIRADLTWQERSEALARLHKLRSEQAARRGEVQTIRATAEEVAGHSIESGGGMAATVKNATILEPYLDDPDVRNAKSEREAVNIAKRKMQQVFLQALAANVKETAHASPNTLLEGSCIDVLPTLPSETFDCICVDPPYGINAHMMAPLTGSDAGQTHDYSDDLDTAINVWESILFEGYRVTKPNAALYMFCDFRHLQTLMQMAAENGWEPWDRPIIWFKRGGGMLGNIEKGPRRSYETIMFCTKGDMKTTGHYFDVIEMAGGSSDLHAAAKPVALIEELLRRSCLPGMTVLDPCCGSGTIFPAANSLHVKATGIEISPTHCATALTRLNEKE